MFARVPDVHFSDAQVAAARTVAARLDGEVGLAYLAGSLAVGLGHGTSDVDMYVVVEDAPGDDVPVDRRTGDPAAPAEDVGYRCGDVVVHVTRLSAARAGRLVGHAEAFTATGMARDQILMEFKQLIALVRLATGWPVLASERWRAQLRRLDRDVIRKILVARHANIAAGYAEDVWGALSSGDAHTAAAASALGLESALEAALAAADDLYVGPKFLFRRLTRTAPTAPWAECAWRLLHRGFDRVGPDEPPETVLPGVAVERLRVAGLLLGWCATEGWDTPLTALPGPQTAAGRVVGSRRSPFFVPVRFADGCALMSEDEGYQVELDVLRAWRDIDQGGASGTASGPAERALLAIGAIDGPDRPGAAGRSRLPADPAVTALIRERPAYSVHPRVVPAA